jgi:hypothetical protein
MVKTYYVNPFETNDVAWGVVPVAGRHSVRTRSSIHRRMLGKTHQISSRRDLQWTQQWCSYSTRHLLDLGCAGVMANLRMGPWQTRTTDWFRQ